VTVRVVDARVEDVGGPLEGAAHDAHSVWRARRGLLLRVRDEGGAEGLGEASPLPGHSEESLDEARAALHAIRWPRLGLDGGADDPLGALGRALDDLPPVPPSVRFAVETAWLDLLGQRLAQPVHRLLDPGGAPRTAALCALVLEDDAASAAAVAVGQGYTTLKLKVGAHAARDLARVRAVRRAVGPGVALRLDANRALPAGSWRGALDALADVSPELFEEPVPLGDVGAAVRGGHALPVALAADESLRSPSDLDALCGLTRSGVYRAWVLKPMRLGGMLRCLALARRARDLGAEVVVSHLFDGPVALAAAGELALALGSPRAAGLAPHAALSAFPPATLASLRGAHLAPHAEGGLGVRFERGGSPP
jgi:L-Ala-D/L-Glu epimerase